MRNLMYCFHQSNANQWICIDGVLVEGPWHICAAVGVTLRRDELVLQNQVEIYSETPACRVAILDTLRAIGLKVLGVEEPYPSWIRVNLRQDLRVVDAIVTDVVQAQPGSHHTYQANIYEKMDRVVHAYERLPHLMMLACFVRKPGSNGDEITIKGLEDLLIPFVGNGVTAKALVDLRVMCQPDVGLDEVLAGSSVVRSWEV